MKMIIVKENCLCVNDLNGRKKRKKMTTRQEARRKQKTFADFFFLFKAKMGIVKLKTSKNKQNKRFCDVNYFGERKKMFFSSSHNCDILQKNEKGDTYEKHFVENLHENKNLFRKQKPLFAFAKKKIRLGRKNIYDLVL